MHCDKCGRDVWRLCVKKLRMMCILEVKRLKHLALVRHAVLDWLVATRAHIDDLFCVDDAADVLVSRGEA
eukprot:6019294-Prymnesium_polylepis.1